MAKEHFQGDSNGNSIITNVLDNGNAQIYLKLVSENSMRLVGTVSDGCLFTERVRGRHLMMKLNAYGFNDFVLRNAKKFDKVVLTDDYGKYVVPVQTILQHGKYLHIKKSGFEKQVFLSLDILNKYRR